MRRPPLARLLFWGARQPLTHALVRRAFAHAAWLLPVRRAGQTPRVLAFYHPRPSWPFHALLVPKRAIPRLLDLTDADLPYLQDLLRLAATIAAAAGPVARGAVLLVNGGAYQDVGQVHFHLAAGGADLDYRAAPAEPPLCAAEQLRISAAQPPRRAVHLLLEPRPPLNNLDELGQRPEAVWTLTSAVQRLVRERELAPTGFTLLAPVMGGAPLRFHLVSGDLTPSAEGVR